MMSHYVLLAYTTSFLLVITPSMAMPLESFRQSDPNFTNESFDGSDKVLNQFSQGTGSGAGAGSGNAGPGGASLVRELNARNERIGWPKKNPVEGYNSIWTSRVAGISSAQNGGFGTGTDSGTANSSTGQAGATGQGSGSSVGK